MITISSHLIVPGQPSLLFHVAAWLPFSNSGTVKWTIAEDLVVNLISKSTKSCSYSKLKVAIKMSFWRQHLIIADIGDLSLFRQSGFGREMEETYLSHAIRGN